MRHELGDALGGLGQVVRDVGDQVGALGGLHEIGIGKAMHMHAVQAAHALGPVLRQPLAAAAHRVEAGAPFVRRAHLEARGVDDAVHRVFHARHQQAVLGDALNALAVGVDQLHMGLVEGLQVFIMEAGPLAQLPVPGLELGGRVLVLHDGVGAGTDLVHLLVIGVFKGGQHPGHGALLRRQQPDLRADAAGQVGPAVLHQVDLGMAAGLVVGEVFQPALLPSGLGRHAGKPVGVDGRIGAHIHR